ncbi:MAG: pectate lyase [Pyrinomonadaceae bacterium]
MKLKLIAILLLLPIVVFPQSKQEVLSAMKKATEFFSTKVSNRGGYVWSVSEDFSRQYGEVPARKSQIWVQSGTPMVGMTMLDAYQATGDKYYLEVAQKAADALIFGQTKEGGWHYVVDFEPKGLQDYYKNQASKFKWGMEEQRFYKGNATLDDGNSQNATRFLLRLYLVSKNEKYKTPLLKALNFFLTAQYPNGAFPQRFPLKFDFIHDGFPDYTSYYTLNDGATVTAIDVLVDAYENLGDKKYLDSAKRAVDFLIAVQGPEDQGCWAEQYHPDTMQPVKARTHEPAGFVIRESEQVIETLEIFYKMTGDRRYLRPIPLCLQWFDRVNKEAIEFKRPPARYYELGTNFPVYVTQTDKTNEIGYGLYEWSNKVSSGSKLGTTGNPSNSNIRQIVNVEPIRREYERVKSIDAKTARAEYEKSKSWSGDSPRPDTPNVANPIKAMDSRGAWVTDCRVLKLDAKEKNGMNSGEFEMIKGYSTGVFVRNISIMTAFVKGK